MSAEAFLARQSAGREAPRQSRLRRLGPRKVFSLSLVRGKPRPARSKLAAPSPHRPESVGCSAAVGRSARVASRLPGGGRILGDSRGASVPRRALPNPSLECRPSEAVRLCPVGGTCSIFANRAKPAHLSGPAQLERSAQ
jgi:hypothetical protein